MRHPKANEQKRVEFKQTIKQYESNGRVIVYIDESGFEQDAPRSHGYSDQHERCYGTHDWQTRKRTNAIGALIGRHLLTVGLFEHSVDADTFHAWVCNDLLPKLPMSSIIVMDNAAFHKREDIQQAISLEGHTLEFLPPYSPDLNPIEKKWAHIKSIRKKYRLPVQKLFTIESIYDG